MEAASEAVIDITSVATEDSFVGADARMETYLFYVCIGRATPLAGRHAPLHESFNIFHVSTSQIFKQPAQVTEITVTVY